MNSRADEPGLTERSGPSSPGHVTWMPAVDVTAPAGSHVHFACYSPSLLVILEISRFLPHCPHLLMPLAPPGGGVGWMYLSLLASGTWSTGQTCREEALMRRGESTVGPAHPLLPLIGSPPSLFPTFTFGPPSLGLTFFLGLCCFPTPVTLRVVGGGECMALCFRPNTAQLRNGV